MTGAETQATFVDIPTGEMPESEEFSLNLRERASQVVEGYQVWAERYPFAATTAETLAVFAVRAGVRRVGNRFNVNLGNAFTASPEAQQEGMEHPFFYGAVSVGIMPIIEELGARALPAKLAQQQREKGRPIMAGTIERVAQVGFAAWHAALVRPEVSFDPLHASVRLKNNDEATSIPVSQYIGGEHLMRLYKKRGLKHAVAAHALNNAIHGVAAIPKIRATRR